MNNDIMEEIESISEEPDIYIETTNLLLKEFEKNEKILDSIFIEFQ